VKKQLILGGLLAAALAVPFGLSPRPAFAHEAPCPFCGQTITQDTASQDNEVALKAGRKRIEYKCVFCALSDAATEYKGDISILAPSKKKGEPILLKRETGKWSAAPEGAVFVAHKASHKICQQTYRAFTSAEAAKAYIAANKDAVGDAVPVSLDEMLKLTGNVK
jgi:hypothetical protein